MKRILSLILFFILLGHSLASAQEWKLDPAHSGFQFNIVHIFSTLRGGFSGFDGELFFDPAVPEKAKFNFSVNVGSIDTNNGKRDNHLRSSDFFNEKHYPEMKFKSSGVTHKNANRYQVDGELTIKDVTKTVSVAFVYLGQKENPFNPGEIVAGFDAAFTINRLDYHVGDGRFYDMGVVGKEVEIFVSLEVKRNK